MKKEYSFQTFAHVKEPLNAGSSRWPQAKRERGETGSAHYPMQPRPARTGRHAPPPANRSVGRAHAHGGITCSSSSFSSLDVRARTYDRRRKPSSRGTPIQVADDPG